VIAVDESPYGNLDTGQSLAGQWFWFTIKYPARAGQYVLRLLALGPGNAAAPSPANTVEIPLTIPVA
jgi:hypothetical protein